MWEIGIPKGSPTPTYMPSTPAISTIALLALVTASIGGSLAALEFPHTHTHVHMAGEWRGSTAVLHEGHCTGKVPG